MPSKALLHEAQQLKDVSGQLELLAEEHPTVTDVILTAERSAALPRFWKCSLLQSWMASRPSDRGVSD